MARPRLAWRAGLLAGALCLGLASPAYAPLVNNETLAQEYLGFLDTPSIIARGPAEVIDGDTIRINGIRLRLHGIEAPEPDETCGTFEDGRPFACGIAAGERLRVLVDVAGGWVICDIVAADVYQRLVGRCQVSGADDIGLTQVEAGYAKAEHADYVLAETAARSAGKGLWDPRFTIPDSWQ